MPTLITYLPLDAGSAKPEYDYLVLREDQGVAQQGRATAALLPSSAARNMEVHAVLPAAVLSWHQVSLPVRVADSLLAPRADAQRARAVLAGAMEDFLLEEPDKLHFAVFANAQTQGGLWVALCQRAWLQVRLQELEAAGHTVVRLVAEHTPVGAGQGVQLALSSAMQPAQAVLCSHRGVTVLPFDASALQWIKAQVAAAQGSAGGVGSDAAGAGGLAGSVGVDVGVNAGFDTGIDMGVDAMAVLSLQVQAEPSVLGLAETAFGSAVQVQNLTQRLAQAAQSPWDLAQFEFSSARRDRAFRGVAQRWSKFLRSPQWRPIRYAVVVLLVLQVVALNALAWRQKSLLAQQRRALETVFTQTFPNLPIVYGALPDMQHELKVLAQSRGVGQADVARLLAVLAANPATAKPLSGWEWNGSELRLRADGLAATDASGVAQALASLGWTANWQDGQMRLTRKDEQ